MVGIVWPLVGVALVSAGAVLLIKAASNGHTPKPPRRKKRDG